MSKFGGCYLFSRMMFSTLITYQLNNVLINELSIAKVRWKSLCTFTIAQCAFIQRHFGVSTLKCCNRIAFLYRFLSYYDAISRITQPPEVQTRRNQAKCQRMAFGSFSHGSCALGVC